MDIKYTSKQKDELIIEYCRNKTVLDIGCVNHDITKEKSNQWIHKCIKTVAKELIGIDYLKDEVTKLNKKGYNIIHANAESFKINKKFDMITGTDIIEHLNNPGKFLQRCKAHLKPNGTLLLSTPNPFNLFAFINYLFRKDYINPEHTLWLCAKTTERLLRNNGFKIEKIYYYNSKYYYKKNKEVRSKSFFIYNLICKITPRIAGQQMFIAKISKK